MGGQAPPSLMSGGKERARWRRFMSRRPVVATGIAFLVLLGGSVGLVLVGADDGSDGTSPNQATGATEEAEAAAFEFAGCMRDHGIDDYPDPTVDADGGIHFEAIPGDHSDEQFQAAQQTCQPILDEARPLGARESPQVEPGAAGAAPAGWERIAPGGGCRCADSSRYSFYAHRANPNKVVFFLDGGGACWSAATCEPEGDNEYQTSVEAPNSGEGVFDVTDERNPFADYSFVFVPYCTADLHVGNAVTEYAPDLTVRHKGYVNGSAALDYLIEAFPDVTDLVVIGASAGSVTSSLYAGVASDRLPETTITVFADSSGAYPDARALNDILAGRAWGADKAIPAWSMNAAATGGRWSAPGLVIQSARHDPDIEFARYDHAYDEDQASHLELAGVSVNDLLAVIDANERQIEGAGVNLLSYIAPGNDHVVFDNESLYTEIVNDTALIDWVARVLDREQVNDVHCTDCAAG
jgi:Pectinacetylesterase